MKIFGIGLSKTGTTSLAQALAMLGYKVKDYPGIERYQPGDLSCLDSRLLEEYDALTDTPIPSFFRELDRAYPGSKFILTVRDAEGWLRSCKKQFTPALAAKQNEAHRRLFFDLYGTDVYDEDKFLQGYSRHVEQVLEYFKDRTSDLLIINLTADDKWDKLCAFLGKPIPERPFPKANVTAITWIQPEQIVQIALSAGIAARGHFGFGPKARLMASLWSGLGAKSLPDPWHVWLRASDHIESSLRAITRDIPIVTRGKDAPPHAIRRRWNHYWLIDPLGCPPWQSVDVREITVNIALIQDGMPFLAVTCHPYSKVVLYGRSDKSIYLQTPTVTSEILNDQIHVDAMTGLSVKNLIFDCCVALCRGNMSWRSESSIHKAQIAIAALIASKLDCELSEKEGGNRIRFDTPDMMVAGLTLSYMQDTSMARHQP